MFSLTGSPVMSDKYENSMWSVPNSDKMLEPPLAQPKFLEVPVLMFTRA